MTNTCPKCGKELVKRVNSKTGVTFIGCSGFPACRFSMSAVTECDLSRPSSPRRMSKEECNEFDNWARQGLASCLRVPNDLPSCLTRTWEGDLADEDYEETTDYEQICHD